MMLKYLLAIALLAFPCLVAARWIEDIVTIENQAIGEVQFSHYQHLDALGKDCVLCHNQIFNIVPAKNRAVSMKEMEQGKSCGSCHNGNAAFSLQENCENCHN